MPFMIRTFPGVEAMKELYLDSGEKIRNQVAGDKHGVRIEVSNRGNRWQAFFIITQVPAQPAEILQKPCRLVAPSGNGCLQGSNDGKTIQFAYVKQIPPQRFSSPLVFPRPAFSSRRNVHNPAYLLKLPCAYIIATRKPTRPSKAPRRII